MRTGHQRAAAVEELAPRLALAVLGIGPLVPGFGSLGRTCSYIAGKGRDRGTSGRAGSCNPARLGLELDRGPRLRLGSWQRRWLEDSGAIVHHRSRRRSHRRTGLSRRIANCHRTEMFRRTGSCRRRLTGRHHHKSRNVRGHPVRSHHVHIRCCDLHDHHHHLRIHDYRRAP